MSEMPDEGEMHAEQLSPNHTLGTRRRARTMQERLNQTPEAARLRRQTVEHPFGTLKAWMGATHFLTKTLQRVRTEMSLHVLAYNMKRALQIFGTQALIEAMRA